MYTKHFNSDRFIEYMAEYLYEFESDKKQQVKTRFEANIKIQILKQENDLNEDELNAGVKNWVDKVILYENFQVIMMYADFDILNSQVLGPMNTVWVETLFEYMANFEE